jgi:ankyrin repeat protein
MGASKSSPNKNFLNAVKIGNLALAEELTDFGANVNFKDREGNTALCLAIIVGSRNIIEWLVEKKQVDINAKNKDGCSPLMYAASIGHTDLLHYLIIKGAIIDDVSNDGYTALHWASYVGNSDSVKLLIKLGANIEALTKSGQTPSELSDVFEIKNYFRNLEKKYGDFTV